MFQRKMMNKWLAVFVTVCLVLSSFPMMAFAQAENSVSKIITDQLSDVEGHWAGSSINKWVNKGIISGYGDDSFQPDRPITRAEFFTLINKTFSFTKEAPISYIDVKSGDWYYNELAKAKEAGYVSGYPDGTIKPNNPISRQEVAFIFNNLLKLTQPSNMGAINQFVDAGDIPGWSWQAVNAMVSGKYMSGYPDGSYQPIKGITRAESAALLSNTVNVLYNTPGNYGPIEGQETIQGNVMVSAEDVKIQNLVITGNLYLTAGIGEGHVELNRVTVKGTTVIAGGGENSIIFKDSTLGEVVVDKKDGKVRVVAQGGTNVTVVRLESGAKLEESSVTSDGFGNITVAVPAGTEVELVGNFGTVDVETPNSSVTLASGSVSMLQVNKQAAGSTIQVASGASVTTLQANAPASVSGTGSIQTANIQADNVTIQQTPTNTNVSEGYNANVGGQPVTGGTQPTPPATGGGGGGGGSSTTAVSAITVTGDAVIGATLTATPTPSNATGNYQWQRSEDGGTTWENISGATSSTYVIASAYAGDLIRVVFTASETFSGTVTSQMIGVSAYVVGAPEGFDFVISPGSIAFTLSNIVDGNGTPVNLDLLTLDGNSLVEFIRTTDQGIVSTLNFMFLGIDASTLSVTKNFADLYDYWMGEAFIEEFDLIESITVTLRGQYDGQAFADIEIADLDFTNKATIRAYILTGLKNGLDSAITSAITLKASTLEGEGVGQAPAAAHANLQAAIDSANVVYNDVGAIIKELYDEIKDLEQAMMNFSGAILTKTIVIGSVTPAETQEGVAVQVNVAIGSNEIADGTAVAVNLHTGIPAGAVVGTEATGTIGLDGTAIVQFNVPGDLAAGNYYFVAQADAVTSGGHLFVVESLLDTSALSDAITSANAAKVGVEISTNGEDVAPGTFWVTQAVNDALDAAIATATAALDTVTTAQEVTDAVAALDAAVVTYNAAKADGTWALDTSGLSDAITAANAAKVGVEISADGTDVAPGTDWVTQAVNDALDAAIATATAALGTVTTAQEVTDAAAALDAAVVTYNAAKADGTLTTAPQGQLLDAEPATDFTGVLYTRGGNIYYNQQDGEGNWGTEAEIGAGTAGRLAIDGAGNPHVV